MAPSTDSIRRIAPFYKFYLLYLEPVMALIGTYLCFADPQRFLTGVLPHSIQTIHPITLDPITKLLCMNLGAAYALFAFIEGGVLRMTRNKGVWLGVFGSMLACDIGHIYAVYYIDPVRFTDFAKWESDEWINYTTLVGGAVLRAMFLLGIGRS